MMELYVLRHCIAKSNEKRIAASISEKYCGGLSKQGLEEAKELANKLKRYRFDVVITSPLKRTKQSLKPHLETPNYKPRKLVLKLVSERRLGELTGKPIEEVGEVRRKSKDQISWKPSGGESILEIYGRAKKFINYLKKNFNKDSKILLCSHSVFLRALDILLTKKDIKKIYSYKGPQHAKLKRYIIK
jgi:broad specificity phosphatase PhoE